MRYKTIVVYNASYMAEQSRIIKRSWTKKAAQQRAVEVVNNGFFFHSGESFIYAKQVVVAHVYTSGDRLVSVHKTEVDA